LDIEDGRQIRDYFGEEVAFFFVWATFYTQSLIFPALCSVPLVIASFSGSLQIANLWYAVMMTGYATVVGELYKRRQNADIQRWGMRHTHQAFDRPEYDASLDNDFHVAKWMLVGGCTMFFYTGVVIATVLGFMLLENAMLNNPDAWWLTSFLQYWCPNKGMLHIVVTRLFVLVLMIELPIADAVWGTLAEFLTQRENHKTRQEHETALVFKLVPMQLFNACFALLNIAFVKPVLGSCKHGDAAHSHSCISELRMAILSFFVSHCLHTLLTLAKNHWTTRRELMAEVERASRIRLLSFTEAQAKLRQCGKLQYDFMRHTAQFTIVICFGQVFPHLSFIALFMNNVQLRMLVHKYCFITQRPYPYRSEGAGAWAKVVASIAKVAVVINVALAAFLMEPLCDLPLTTKLIIFVGVEHALLVIKGLLEAVVDDVPREVRRVDEANRKAVPMILRLVDGELEPVRIEDHLLNPKVNIDADMSAI